MSYDTEITLYPSEDLKGRLDRAADEAGVTTSRLILNVLAQKFPQRASVDPALRERGIEAAAESYKAKGYEVLATQYDADNGVTFDIIAANAETFAFAWVDVRTGTMPSGLPPYGRDEAAEAAAEFFSTTQMENRGVRFDNVCICVCTDGDSAIMRHHANVF